MQVVPYSRDSPVECIGGSQESRALTSVLEDYVFQCFEYSINTLREGAGCRSWENSTGPELQSPQFHQQKTLQLIGGSRGWAACWPWAHGLSDCIYAQMNGVYSYLGPPGPSTPKLPAAWTACPHLFLLLFTTALHCSLLPRGCGMLSPQVP